MPSESSLRSDSEVKGGMRGWPKLLEGGGPGLGELVGERGENDELTFSMTVDLHGANQTSTSRLCSNCLSRVIWVLRGVSRMFLLVLSGAIIGVGELYAESRCNDPSYV